MGPEAYLWRSPAAFNTDEFDAGVLVATLQGLVNRNASTFGASGRGSAVSTGGEFSESVCGLCGTMCTRTRARASERSGEHTIFRCLMLCERIARALYPRNFDTQLLASLTHDHHTFESPR